MVKQYGIYWVSLDLTVGNEIKKNQTLFSDFSRCFQQTFKYCAGSPAYFNYSKISYANVNCYRKKKRPGRFRSNSMYR